MTVLKISIKNFRRTTPHLFSLESPSPSRPGPRTSTFQCQFTGGRLRDEQRKRLRLWLSDKTDGHVRHGSCKLLFVESDISHASQPRIKMAPTIVPGVVQKCNCRKLLLRRFTHWLSKPITRSSTSIINFSEKIFLLFLAETSAITELNVLKLGHEKARLIE